MWVEERTAEREKTTALDKWRKMSWLSFQFLILVPNVLYLNLSVSVLHQ